ncbi:hypothetical protein HYW74_00955 [Candidatus Pacearchaeota archaeon]|nr:hypothetical protein [Candidatus Pacearchaeota archaeon]
MASKKEDLIRKVLPKLDFSIKPRFTFKANLIKNGKELNWQDPFSTMFVGAYKREEYDEPEKGDNERYVFDLLTGPHDPRETKVEIKKRKFDGRTIKSISVEDILEVSEYSRTEYVTVKVNDCLFVCYTDKDYNGIVDQFSYGDVINTYSSTTVNNGFRTFHIPKTRRFFYTKKEPRVGIYKELDEEFLKAKGWLDDVRNFDHVSRAIELFKK